MFDKDGLRFEIRPETYLVFVDEEYRFPCLFLFHPCVREFPDLAAETRRVLRNGKMFVSLGQALLLP
jgi:hypothetical protein